MTYPLDAFVRFKSSNYRSIELGNNVFSFNAVIIWFFKFIIAYIIVTECYDISIRLIIIFPGND